MGRCPECKGAGQTVLFMYPSTCRSCGGTGKTSSGEAEESSRSPGGTLRPGSGAAPGGDITTRGGDAVPGSIGGDLTVTGNADVGTFWIESAHPSTTLTFTDAAGTDTSVVSTTSTSSTIRLSSSASGPSFQIGPLDPTKDAVSAPVGSMYISEATSVVNVMTEEGWRPLATAPSGDPVEDGFVKLSRARRSTIVDRVVDALWRRERAIEELREKGEPWVHEPSPDFPDRAVPCVAPVGLWLPAELLAILEQRGHEPVAFVVSCRDFADVRVFRDTQHLRWEGGRVWVYGVEVLRDERLRPGTFVAVAEESMALAEITR